MEAKVPLNHRKEETYLVMSQYLSSLAAIIWFSIAWVISRHQAFALMKLLRLASSKDRRAPSLQLANQLDSNEPILLKYLCQTFQQPTLKTPRKSKLWPQKWAQLAKLRDFKRVCSRQRLLELANTTWFNLNLWGEPRSQPSISATFSKNIRICSSRRTN